MRAPVPAGALNLRVHFLSTTSAPVLPIGQFANLRMVFNGVGLHPGGDAMNPTYSDNVLRLSILTKSLQEWIRTYLVAPWASLVGLS